MSDECEFDFIYSSQDSIENELEEFYALDGAIEDIDKEDNYFYQLMNNLKSKKFDIQEIIKDSTIFQKIRDNLHDVNCMGVIYYILLNVGWESNILDFIKELFNFEQLTNLNKKSLSVNDLSVKETSFIVKRCLLLHKLLTIFTKDLPEIKKNKRKE